MYALDCVTIGGGDKSENVSAVSCLLVTSSLFRQPKEARYDLELAQSKCAGKIARQVKVLRPASGERTRA